MRLYAKIYVVSFICIFIIATLLIKAILLIAILCWRIVQNISISGLK